MSEITRNPEQSEPQITGAEFLEAKQSDAERAISQRLNLGASPELAEKAAKIVETPETAGVHREAVIPLKERYSDPAEAKKALESLVSSPPANLERQAGAANTLQEQMEEAWKSHQQ